MLYAFLNFMDIVFFCFFFFLLVFLNTRAFNISSRSHFISYFLLIYYIFMPLPALSLLLHSPLLLACLSSLYPLFAPAFLPSPLLVLIYTYIYSSMFYKYINMYIFSFIYVAFLFMLILDANLSLVSLSECLLLFD